MGQKGEKCKEAVEIGMIGSLSGMSVGAGCVGRVSAWSGQGLPELLCWFCDAFRL
jgi:hypothetical protein